MIQSKVLFVGAGSSQLPAIQHARLLGYIPYAVDADANAVGFKYAEGYDVGDIRDPEFLKTCALRFNIYAILSISTDAAVPSVARVCEMLGYASISVLAADISVNKLLQREAMKAGGLRTPLFMPFANIQQLVKNYRHIDFPLVVKPIDTAGSRGVTLVNNQIEMILAATKALEISTSNMGLIEEYIEGKEVSVEGFVVDGEFHELCVSEKTRTPAPFMLDTKVCFPDQLSKRERGIILDEASKAISACGLDRCPVHVELLRSKDGPVIVELAARGPGFRVFTNIIPYVTGVDTIKVLIKLALGENVEININKKLKGAVIKFIGPSQGVLKNVIGLEQARRLPCVKEAEIYIEPGSVMNKLECGADRIGHILALGDNRQEAEKYAEQALSLIKLELV